MASKASAPHFVLKFKLKTEPWQEDVMDKRFEAGRQIYNALANVSLKHWNELKKTKKYRALLDSLNHDKAHDKPVWAEINRLRCEAGLTEYGLSKMITPIRKHFEKHIGAHLAQKLSLSVWRSFEKLFKGESKAIHFKKYGQLNSLEGKTNTTGILFKPERRECIWSNLRMLVLVDEKNPYEMEALKMPIAYCRILRESVRGKRKYYLQVVFKGRKPAKRHKSDGTFVHLLGKGDVGIDIGTSTIAYASEKEVRIEELADKAQGYERERHRLLRKLDRSRRATNPDQFHEDGTAVRHAKGNRPIWHRSKCYEKVLARLKETYRKQREVRKLQHELLANHLLTLGDTFYVEDMNFKALQRRSAKTEKNEKGRFKRKKRFGKSLANRAPAMLLSILNRKLQEFGRTLIKIDTREARASQFNHVEGTYKKKKLSQRWNLIAGLKIQRDMYSAFLIQNVNPDLKTFDLEKCNRRFPDFIQMHNAEVTRLLGNHNLSSIGI
ncbi:hypothetical protein [Mitsuokella sp.]|uniref:hypothetical protein n=1 Tax=Mitsuokella sp. TaxID=2049034 RepID=UPI003D7DFB82